jgi:hypothetical protein
MPHRTIESPQDIEDFARLLSNSKLPITVEWVQGKDRSADQNALQWLWAKEAAEQLGDRTTTEMQHEWKLRYGVPILREDSPEFRAKYDECLRPLPYEAKLGFMEYLDVTSIMKVRQMVRYLDTIQREMLQQGIRLTDPEQSLTKYQARYR